MIDEIISWLLVIFGTAFPLYSIFGILGFKGFEELTSYVDLSTPYHKINPVTKLLILFSVTLIAVQSIWWVGLILGMIAIPFYYFLRRLKVILIFSLAQIIGLSWGFATFTSPTVLREIFGNNLTIIWKWPSYFIYMGYVPDLTLQAIIYSIQVSMRIWPMSLFSGLIFLTVNPSDLIRSMHKIKIPLSLIFAVAVGVISVPRIFEVADTAIKLQLMKGIGYKRNRILKIFFKIKAMFEAIIPLTIYEFKKARLISLSAETRAFMAYKDRTYLNDINFSKIDKTIVIILIIAIIIDSYLVYSGYIPAIPVHG